MTATAHAVQPPAHAPAPPVQRKADPMADQQEAPQRLLTSLSAVPAIQRACASCDADDPAPSLQSAHPSVQRKCAACAAEDRDEKMPVQPQLEVGPVDDPYEREADDIAGRVMAMRDPGTASQAGSSVQRACAACSSKSDEVQRAPALPETLMDDDTEVPRMRSQPGGGGERITASAAQLTSGGASLSDQTRSYFETRMGRDLSDVRVHRGSDSDALNSSISARAFTYQNHIWLSGAESEGPSFTMAHELAHVLQQTQPGSVSPMIRRAPSEIISETLYFGEEPKKKGKLDTHDLVVADAVKKNSKLMGEVAVPNALRSGPAENSFGYADLVLSDPNKLWGIRFEPYWGKKTPLPWYVVSEGGKNIAPKSLGYHDDKQLYYQGSAVKAGRGFKTYNTDASPRFGVIDRRSGTKDYLRGAADAPKSYEIGDVKFAGDKDRSSLVEKQTGYYVDGFNKAASNYNKTVAQSQAVSNGTAGGTHTGSSRLNSLAKTSFTAKKMTSASGPTSFIPLETDLKLRLRKFSKTILGEDKFEDVTGFTYDGASYYRQNPSKKNLWEYVFWPNEIKEQDNATSRTNRRSKLTDASKSLYDDMVSSPTGKKVMPLRKAPVRVQPRKPKKKLPPATDPFQAKYATWDKDQKAFTTTFANYTNIKTGTGKDDVAKLAFDTAIQNTANLLGGKGPDGRKPSLKSTVKFDTAQKEFNQSELIEGRSGRMLGWMRKTFGKTFVKALNIYTELKTKFEAFLKGAKKRTSGGKIGKAIMKVGGVIFGTIIKTMLPQIGAYLVDCVEEGFKNMMKSMMEIDFSKYSDAIEARIQKKYAELTAKIEADIEAASESIKNRFGAIYESVMDKWETAKTLLSIARHVFNVARAAACAAGGLETLGISCVVAGVDYVLSLFDASPSEHLLAHLLGSCVAQGLIKEFILGRAIIQNLPKEISETIRKYVKDALPPELKPIICDKIGDTPDLPAASEIPCEDINNPGSGRGGSDLSKAPPEFPADMQKRKATRKEIRKNGRLDKGVIDKSGEFDRSKLSEEFKELLKPEAPPPPGTPEVWDPPDGGSPPKVKETTPSDPKEEKKPTTDPSAGAGTGVGGQAGSTARPKQSIRRGTIANPTGTVTAYYTIIPGPSGGFKHGTGDGKTLFDVFLYVQTSEMETFGPLPIKIKVFNVKRFKSGDWIKFLPDGPYVLSSGTNDVEINPAEHDYFWAKLSGDK